MSDAGLQKATILMIALGEDCAADVMRHLAPRDVQKLGLSMANIGSVSHESVAATLEEFVNNTDISTSFNINSGDYIQNVLVKALGDDRATHLLQRILDQPNTSGIEHLKWMDALSVANMIQHEHPQIIATILAHLERDQASEILAQFTETLRHDVILRIATLDGVQPAAMQALNEVLSKLLAGNQTAQKKSMGGIRAVAEMLNFMSGDHETAILDNLRQYDNTMAEKVVDEMFIFDQIADIDDRGIQTLLREVQSETLIVALKGASPELRDKFFKNMSQRAAEMMRDDLESKGPVRLSEVEAQQKEILTIARRLSDEGQIMLGSKGKGEAFV